MRLVPYDPGWPAAFALEASRLRSGLGTLALRIDHHGSTAVPGLSAKPIIDIQVSVVSLQPMSAFVGPLQRLGYTHVAHADDIRFPFFHRPRRWPHSHHLHVVEHGGREERRTLVFRDYLRDHPATARDYERVKQLLAARADEANPEARENYAVGKSSFVEQVVAAALAAGYPKALREGEQRPA